MRRHEGVEVEPAGVAMAIRTASRFKFTEPNTATKVAYKITSKVDQVDRKISKSDSFNRTN